jgi:hypothetical protein
MEFIILTLGRLGLLIGGVVVCYIVYRFIRIFVPRAVISYYKSDGRLRKEGLVKYSVINDRYSARDITLEIGKQKVGEIFTADDGKAWVRLIKEKEGLSEPVFENIGYLDPDGVVYDNNHCKVGYLGSAPGFPDMNGRRKWYELFLNVHAYVFLYDKQEQILSNAGAEGTAGQTVSPSADKCIGKCTEYGRFRRPRFNSYTALGRAAAFMLLYQREKVSEPLPEDATPAIYCWHDTALLSTIVFMLFYAIVYIAGFEVISMPFLGELSFTVSMIFFYFFIWLLMRQFKIEQSLIGRPIGHFLMLLNRNAGVSGLNKLTVAVSAIAIFISVFVYGGDFFALLLSIIIGLTVNMKFGLKGTWKVYTYFALPPPPEPEEDDAYTDTGGMISHNYVWDLDSDAINLRGELDLFFCQEEIDELRSINPFRKYASQDFEKNISLLFKEKIDEYHLRKINRYIMTKAYDERLSALDGMQFILDFVQEPNISYLADNESTETGGGEYARFPVETLFDKRGDCDCKAVLAAALFRNAGYKVAYVVSQNHAAVAVACPPEWFRIGDGDYFRKESNAFIGKDGAFYYFCETTSDSFRIGDYDESVRPEDFKNIIFLK